MDYNKIIRELYADKRKLDRVIAELEELVGLQRTNSLSAAHPATRGRKYMSSEEREEVSRRMKRYWENRRKQSGSGKL